MCSFKKLRFHPACASPGTGNCRIAHPHAGFHVRRAEARSAVARVPGKSARCRGSARAVLVGGQPPPAAACGFLGLP